jgi:Collagen triple helix repeat (20 copies)
MSKRAARSPGDHQRRWWAAAPIVVSGLALFIAFGGSAIAKGLIHAGDIATGAVTSKTIKNGGIMFSDLNATTQASLRGAQGGTGATGSTGLSGAPGAGGTNGAAGAGGTNGAPGAAGSNGAPGAAGSNGAPGANGVDGEDGTNGTNGINGTIAPLWSTNGLTPIPTSVSPTTVVDLTVPAGDYVVLAKSQLSHTGAGDSINCSLKAGGATIDQVSMKTLPALAAIPMSLQAVTTLASPTLLHLDCVVLVAGGSADFSSLIAIPTG